MNLPLPEWLPRSNTANVLAGAFLLSALYAAAQRRVPAAITACRFNAVALGLIALVVAVATGARQMVLAALLVLAIKAVAIPALLARRVRRGRGRAGTEPILGVPAGMLVCGALVVVAFSQTRALLGPGAGILASCLPVSVAGALVGLFVMVSRRDAAVQVVGLLLLDNAVFLAAVSLASGMPLVVEMGVLLDLLVVFALSGPFVARIEQARGDADRSRPASPGD